MVALDVCVSLPASSHSDANTRNGTLERTGATGVKWPGYLHRFITLDPQVHEIDWGMMPHEIRSQRHVYIWLFVLLRVLYLCVCAAHAVYVCELCVCVCVLCVHVCALCSCVYVSAVLLCVCVCCVLLCVCMCAMIPE